MGLYLRFQPRNYCAADVAAFLHLLLHQHLRGPVILLWDNGRIHKGPFIARLRHAYPRLQIEPFPGYAPELNPVEQVWNDFKGHTANTLFRNRRHLRITLHNNTRRVCRSQQKLRSFVLSSGLPSPLW
jgi:putative transposase